MLAACGRSHLDGIPLATSPLAFMDGDLDTALDLTTTGGHISTPVMTGGVPGVIPSMGASCSDYTSTTDPANVVAGHSDTSTRAAFDGVGGVNCSGLPIYCLEP
jgi:hypothetical protein